MKRTACLLLGCAITAMPAMAVTVSGTVRGEEGEPLAGVMVRLYDAGTGIGEAVFTDAEGSYALDTRLEGTVQLRLRLPYYQDLVERIDLAVESAAAREWRLSAMRDDGEISDSLPAAYHFGSLPFTAPGEPFSRLEFQRDCLSCHQLGNALTRAPRSAEAWAQVIARMHLYLGNFDMALRDERSRILARGFEGTAIDARPLFPLSAELFDARITSYRLQQAGVPHDTIHNPDDGLLYTVDQMLDHVAVTDPATGVTEYVAQAGGEATSYRQGVADDEPVRGEFSPQSRHGPHSLALGGDGKYYVTNSGSRSIGVFDPVARAWEPSHLIARETGAIYPHTVRVAADGMVWFSLAGSDQVGRLDPQAGEFTVIDVPERQVLGIAGTTQVYGIDIHPGDGGVWYGRLFGDSIGRIDPETQAVTEFPSPVSGPRRMRFDADGMLWVTGYANGQLAKIDPEGFRATVYDMPEFAPGYRPAPYALGVHPASGDIWVNENMTDRIYRFIPGEERWVFYPVPLRGTYTRDMTFTADGQVCTSNNPLPAAALEGGVLEILCIDPDYRVRLQAVAAP